MKYENMSAEQKAEHDALVAVQVADDAIKAEAKAARKAQRDARLIQIPGNAGLPELRAIVQGLIDELKGPNPEEL